MKRMIASLVMGTLFTAPALAGPDIEGFFVPQLTKTTATLCHRNAEAFTCYVLKPRLTGDGCADDQLTGIMRQADMNPLFIPAAPVIRSTPQLVSELKKLGDTPVSGNFFYCPGSSTDGFMCIDTGQRDGTFDYNICTRSVTDVFDVPEGRPFP